MTTLVEPVVASPDTAPVVPRVIGLDLSLTCTGVAGPGWTDRIRPLPSLRGHQRLATIRAAVLEYASDVALVVVEGPSYGSQAGQSGHHERAGLWWLVTHALWTRHIPVAVAPPASAKKYATGKGNADKALMMREVARRFVWFDGGEDEADALVLCALGCDQLGAPLAAMPVTHRAALASVKWPELSTLVGAPC